MIFPLQMDPKDAETESLCFCWNFICFIYTEWKRLHHKHFIVLLQIQQQKLITKLPLVFQRNTEHYAQ